MTIPGEGVDVNSRTPTLGCSLIQDYIGEAFHSHSIPCNVGGRLEWNLATAMAEK